EPAGRAERGRCVLTLVASGGFAIAVGAHAAAIVDNGLVPPAPVARDASSLASEERLAPFRRVDFFPRGLREAAAHVARHTSESDTVQTYGMDPYVLFLAQ